MIPKKQNVAIIHEHYHVTDAGMRHVLATLSHGVDRYFGPAAQYLWYSPQKYRHRVLPSERFSHPSIILIEDHELGYWTDALDSVALFEAAVARRKQIKLEILRQKIKAYGAVVHIIQNPTLLKNPVETQANARMAAELLDQDYIQIWHIHDFMEDAPARQSLRDGIKRFAGDETENIYGRNGCGMAWTTSPNIFYAVINMKDRSALRGFLPENLGKNIFYFPDAVDVETIRTPSLLHPHAETIDDRINSYCESRSEKGYTYDPAADLLLATEFARERKNTGEQILLLNLLNSLRHPQGRRFQLLITLIPTMGKDAERIKIFQEYIRLNNLPVVMGFGSRIIARSNDVAAGQFTMTDLWRHPRARVVISTSVKEGFGLNFINPAIATFDHKYTLPTVGRRLRDIFPDFEALGMTLHESAFYDSLIMDESILSEDSDFFDDKREHIIKERLPQRYKTLSYDGLIPVGEDFSCYPADEQVLLMDIIDYRRLSNRLSGFIDSILDRDGMNRMAKDNAVAIMDHLSLPSYIERLKGMIENAFTYKQARLSQGEHPETMLDNTPLTDFFADMDKPSEG